MMESDLLRRLGDWDQQDTGMLKQIHAEYCNAPAFLEALASTCADRDKQAAASWLIKHHLEQTRRSPDIRMTDQLLAALPQTHAWAAQLHILQILDRLTLPDGCRMDLIDFIDRAGQSNKAMVRAWAYYGLAVAAVRFPDLKDLTVETLLRAGKTETAGSIKVRVRKALEKLGA